MNCEQACELAALAASDDLTPGEDRALAEHLVNCGECRAEAQAFEALRDQLAGMREESAPDAAYAAVRTRVLGEIGERRVGWAILSPAFALVVACTVILAVVLHTGRTVVPPPAHQPMALMADAGVPEAAPALAAPARVHKVRHALIPVKAQGAVEPLVMQMFTDDPDVVIYWIADGRGSSAEKESIQ